ncbi:MAG TPA: hypothetical protein VM095_11535, partial [Pyrinomonadaceae bacterium]|nr:hypothetical protein [Pyrinomonadaceae bacterium]
STRQGACLSKTLRAELTDSLEPRLRRGNIRPTIVSHSISRLLLFTSCGVDRGRASERCYRVNPQPGNLDELDD